MKRIFRFLLKCCVWFVILTVLWVVIYRYIPIYYTPLMAIRSFENTEKSSTFKHNWVDIEDISIHLQKAVICSEDQKFINHNGFDIEAIEKAYENNKKSKRIKGASTISQQTAKNVFLWPNRSWLRKGLETYFTFLIEKLWSKERILEVYLNSIEMGNGVYGAEAASQHWFGTSAKGLNINQSAAIAAILPNPRRYKAQPATSYISARKQWIIKQMGFYGPLKFPKKDDENSKH
ncbi:monofunctional biosynthetic peptidoglycan transglycosylase [Mesoflavibacter sabulilitoris]|uniref:Biosynthetic peptidoglycan transglycosylase n=1 Tax=Mesoflavibacter zeaxanthinifaciens subsp. sabulilitoris TaxID=1520893 RepID=A0A2T1N6P2_9FLAO|nr:monofunctional biosynthetic peptidoglycan transglycosylase [Mesoflavibacter zeaxanthinifaciens]MBB3123105.1 monofunctional biosynthetic peptidoglycan transglycosylase [Mesoflavibacter zeaxanthinifaciens subsp. sabulilitoris]PSG87251.1 monofunctional biosynthetic peptidoglycan transglycosylase [Mesoflavibacter zeaxanthinifaciens subsp. sabulilitoris]